MNLKLFLIALTIFLILDIIWIGLVANKMYQNLLESMVADKFKVISAILFYFIYLVGIVYFVLIPGVSNESLVEVIVRGAFLGLLCYATYDLTNYATLENWPLQITIIDLIWGVFLTTTVSVSTYYIYLNFLSV